MAKTIQLSVRVDESLLDEIDALGRDLSPRGHAYPRAVTLRILLTRGIEALRVERAEAQKASRRR
jgi:hypothetical protein